MRVAAIALGLAVLAGAGCGAEEPAPAPPPQPSTPPPAEPVAEPEPPAPAPPPYRVRLVRTSTELLVFAVQGPRALPASRIPVRVPLGEEKEDVVAVTSSSGVAVLRVPAEVEGSIVVGQEGTTTTVPLPPVPAATTGEPARPGLLLVDRSEARPGDLLRIALRMERFADRNLPGKIHLPGEEVPLGFVTAGGRAPGWTLATVEVPSDARPGRARVRWKDYEVPLLLRARYGKPLPLEDPDTGRVEPGDAPEPRESGDLTIEPEDGQWRVTAPGPLDGRPVVLLAHDGRGILSHETAMEEARSVLIRLALGERDPEGVTLIALTADRDGFPEGRVALADLWEGSRMELGASVSEDGKRLELAAGVTGETTLKEVVFALDDPERPDVPARLHRVSGPNVADSLSGIVPGARYRVRAVGRLTAGGRVLHAELPALDPVPGDPPPVAPSFQRAADVWRGPGRPRLVPLTRWIENVDLVPGTPMTDAQRQTLLDTGRASFTWNVLAPEGASGPVRLSSDGVILLETGVGADAGVGRQGVLPRSFLEGEELTVEAAVPGLRALRIGGIALESGLDDEAVDEGYSVSRTVREGGEDADRVAVITLRRTGPRSPVLVEMPLPAGCVPARDGWELRRAAAALLPDEPPSNVRVRVRDTIIQWLLPAVPREGLTLEVPLRDAHVGTWTWPPVHVTGEHDDAPRGRSRGGRLVIGER